MNRIRPETHFLMEMNYREWKKEENEGEKTLQKQQKHRLTTQTQRSDLRVQVSDNTDGSVCTGWQARSIWRGAWRHKHKLSKESKVDFNQLKGDKT